MRTAIAAASARAEAGPLELLGPPALDELLLGGPGGEVCGRHHRISLSPILFG